MEWPVVPTEPITCPWLTRAPTEVPKRDWWRVAVESAPPCWTQVKLP